MPKMIKLSNEELMKTVVAYHSAGSHQARTAELLGLSPSRVSEHLTEARKRGLLVQPRGESDELEAIPHHLPKKGEVLRYLVTCAQSNTKIHVPFWKNLLAMAEHYDAELLVSTFRYNKNALGQSNAAKKHLTDAELKALEFPAELEPFICDERIDLAPALTFCGELQILPTARRPLQGFETYTYRKSTIVPHTSIAMKSVASVKDEGVKLLYTTGCITKRNYIQRREGFRADHFHTYGALLVEVDHEGSWWCRQVTQGADGTLRDLNLVFKNGNLTSEKARVENITWGDIHASKVDLEVAAACWNGPGGDKMLDVLKPKSQHVHDVMDCGPFGHHTQKDAFASFRAYHKDDRRSMITEFTETGAVLASMTRPWCQTFVVNANHDRHLERYLKEADWRADPENALTILELTKRSLQAILDDDDGFNLLQEAIELGVGLPNNCTFLQEDKSHVILRDVRGGIEMALHGDRGVNGAKGTASGLAKLGRPVNMADKHAAEVHDHVWVAGVSACLDMGYNKGPSSWTHSHIVTYPNGQRAMITLWKGRWRA